MAQPAIPGLHSILLPHDPGSILSSGEFFGGDFGRNFTDRGVHVGLLTWLLFVGDGWRATVARGDCGGGGAVRPPGLARLLNSPAEKHTTRFRATPQKRLFDVTSVGQRKYLFDVTSVVQRKYLFDVTSVGQRSSPWTRNSVTVEIKISPPVQAPFS